MLLVPAVFGSSRAIFNDGDVWKPSTPSLTAVFFAVLVAKLALMGVEKPVTAVGAVAAACRAARAGDAPGPPQAMLAIIAAPVLPEGFARGAKLQAGDHPLSSAIAMAGAALTSYRPAAADGQ